MNEDEKDEKGGVAALKQEFTLPKLYSVSHNGKWSKEIRGYKFFIPANYERDPDGKHTLVQDKQNN